MAFLAPLAEGLIGGEAAGGAAAAEGGGAGLFGKAKDAAGLFGGSGGSRGSSSNSNSQFNLDGLGNGYNPQQTANEVHG